MGVFRSSGFDPSLVNHRPVIWFFRYLATYHQHRDNYHHISNGFSDPHTESRDKGTINLKLDELIRAVKEARNNMVNLENAPDEELENIQVQFQQIREKVINGENKPHKTSTTNNK